MSNTGDADLSLSELSLKEQPVPPSKEKPRSKSKPRPFTLLARRSPSPESEPEPEEENGAVDDAVEEAGGDAVEAGEELDTVKNGKKREEKLQHDLFVLRRLNESFKAYNSALDASGLATSRVAEQLGQTNALLDRYVSLLSRSEDSTKLLFDERWWGAEEDERILEQEQREALERSRKAEEDRLRLLQLEKERQEKAEAEARAKEERERLEAERNAKLATKAGYGSGVRGVRGTRASARGRGVARASPTGTGSSSSSTLSRGRSIPVATSRISRLSPAGSTGRGISRGSR